MTPPKTAAADRAEDGRHARIGGIDLTLAHPDVIEMKWIGNQRLRDQLVAAWMTVAPSDIPLNPRLIGKPGVGKTTL
ncbi:MAG TPA: hypothetical protein PLS90_15115, partial [Candidatus Sumerlaeota bacterium]|nr:hypothetical protein [Candidatus Sumerlaeota bacterium]